MIILTVIIDELRKEVVKASFEHEPITAQEKGYKNYICKAVDRAIKRLGVRAKREAEVKNE